MPEFMSPLVVSTINSHVNLNNSENLEEYTGPIRIIRRVDDEIIADPPGVLACNRGNNLIVEHVIRRYGGNVSEAAKKELLDWVNLPHDRDNPVVDCLRGDKVEEKDDGKGLVATVSSYLIVVIYDMYANANDLN